MIKDNIIAPPDLNEFENPLEYLRAVHVEINRTLTSLEQFTLKATQEGIRVALTATDSLKKEREFLEGEAAHHEAIEEKIVFPWLLKRLPHTGFLRAEAPIRFLIEGHGVLQERTKAMIECCLDLEKDLSKQPSNHFLPDIREVVSLYRDHLRLEETEIYPLAEKFMGSADLEQLRRNMVQDQQSLGKMPEPTFDDFNTSTPSIQVTYKSSETSEDE